MNRRIATLSFAVSGLLLAGCASLTEPAEERLNIRGEITLLQTDGMQHKYALAEIISKKIRRFPCRSG